MLNTFPTLLTYSWYAPLILRLVLGVILIDLGILKFKGERADWIKTLSAYKIKPAYLWVSIYGLLEAVAGIFLVVGFLTQVSALVVAVLALIELYTEYTEGGILKRDIVFYILILAIALSLLLTGAGAYARDLPL